MREIRTLRAKRRGLETESRTTLGGHKGGNPGYGQGKSYGLPRQSSTLPGVCAYRRLRAEAPFQAAQRKYR